MTGHSPNHPVSIGRFGRVLTFVAVCVSLLVATTAPSSASASAMKPPKDREILVVYRNLTNPATQRAAMAAVFAAANVGNSWNDAATWTQRPSSACHRAALRSSFRIISELDRMNSSNAAAETAVLDMFALAKKLGPSAYGPAFTIGGSVAKSAANMTRTMTWHQLATSQLLNVKAAC